MARCPAATCQLPGLAKEQLISAATIISLIIQIVAGTIGGNIFAKVTQFTLGPIYDSIMGAVGGTIGGVIFQGLGPGLTSSDPVGAMSSAIVTVFASLSWNPIDYWRRS